MKKYMKCLTFSLLIGILLLTLKNEFSPLLLKDASYGIPALIAQGYVDNLYLGSSMFRQGIDIMTLEDNGEKNYILAYNGNQPALEYYQLKTLLNNGLKINNLYVDMYVYSAWAQPKISDVKMLMEFGLSDKWSLYKLLPSDWKLFWQMFVTGNNELLSTWIINGQLVNSYFYKGGTTAKPSASDKIRLDSLTLPEIDESMNPVQKEFSIKLIQLAKDNGINLVYLESPKYCNMADNPEYIRAMSQYIDFLESQDAAYILCDITWKLTGQKENCKYYLYDNSNSEYYVDNGHLSYAGRLEYTQKIEELTKRVH